MWMPYGRRTEQSGDGAGSTRVSEDSLHHRINISWKEPLNRNAQPLAPPPRVPPNLGKSGRPFCSFSNFHFEMNKHPGNPMVGAAIPICKCILCKYIHFREREMKSTPGIWTPNDAHSIVPGECTDAEGNKMHYFSGWKQNYISILYGLLALAG